MLAIVGEIVVVVLAVAAGAGAGWLFGRRGRDRVVAAAREEATAGTLSLADDLYARTQRLNVLEARLARTHDQLAGRSGALAAATERLRALENEAEVRSREFAALEDERARLGARVAELVGTESAGPERARELERLLAELAMRESQIAGLHARIAALEAALAEREARVHELAGALPAPASAMAPASPTTRLPEMPVTARRRRGNGGERDDLKRIPGIGPATERILHGAGVYTFRQIANWRAEDLDAFAAKLGELAARVKRDTWIDGARREHLKKYGETP